MINRQPILIAGPPRCGTTMLAGLIAPHDVWVGRARITDYPGTNTEFAAENQDIKGVFKDLAADIGYRNWTVPLPEQPLVWSDMDKAIKQFVPDDQPWLVKTTWNVIWWKFWHAYYPDALWVLPQREMSSVMNSISRHPRMARRPRKMSYLFIKAVYEQQRHLKKVVSNSHVVPVYKISQGDCRTIESLFEFLNIEPDWNKIEKWIQPERMKK